MGRKPSTVLPKCEELDCFANRNGYCKCLTNTDFWYKKDKKCPFKKKGENNEA